MKKIRFEQDPYNRLVIDERRGKSSLPEFRKVLDGLFSTDENNNLYYHIKAPVSQEADIPNQIKLRGTWSLTNNHELRLTLDKKTRETFGDQITLHGEILDVNGNSILFAITTTSKENTQSTYVLNLAGSWKADKNNRLSFYVKKEKGKYDILTFNGIWEINKNHQIVYQYEKAGLLTKEKTTHILTFKGYWDIKNKLRISYVLDQRSDSAFEFTASTGVFKDGYIEYELGIGIKSRVKPVTRTLVLSGSWRLEKNSGLMFDMEYENGKTHSIVFGADARLTDRDTVIFRLKNELENKDIGAILELSHEILNGDGEAFLRVLKSRHESAIYAGAGWRW